MWPSPFYCAGTWHPLWGRDSYHGILSLDPQVGPIPNVLTPIFYRLQCPHGVCSPRGRIEYPPVWVQRELKRDRDTWIKKKNREETKLTKIYFTCAVFLAEAELGICSPRLSLGLRDISYFHQNRRWFQATSNTGGREALLLCSCWTVGAFAQGVGCPSSVSVSTQGNSNSYCISGGFCNQQATGCSESILGSCC